MPNHENATPSSINVNMAIYRLYEIADNGDKLLQEAKNYFGFFSRDDAISYLDNLEETYYNYHDKELTITREDDEHLVVAYEEENGVKKENTYSIELSQVYY